MLFGNDKMSKSKGNIVYADDLVNKFGVDAIRFYMIHEMPFGSDGVYTEELLVDTINSNLANVVGNLINRTIGMVNKYFDGIVTNTRASEEKDKELIDFVLSLKEKIDDNISKFRIADSLENLIDAYRRCNKYIDETTPWILAKDETKRDLRKGKESGLFTNELNHQISFEQQQCATYYALLSMNDLLS